MLPCQEHGEIPKGIIACLSSPTTIGLRHKVGAKKYDIISNVINPVVYILKSIKNGRYYIGSTGNIERRLEEHNAGKVYATSKTKPWSLGIFISCSNLTEAKQCEYRLKKYKRRDIVEKVIKDGIFPWNY